jgi:hypothetical protein
MLRLIMIGTNLSHVCLQEMPNLQNKFFCFSFTLLTRDGKNSDWAPEILDSNFFLLVDLSFTGRNIKNR